MTKRFTREAREAAVARMKEGADATALATELGCHPATLSGWLRKSQIDPQNAPQPGGGAAGAEKLLGAQAAQAQAAKPMDPEVLVGAFKGLRTMIVDGIGNAKGLDTTQAAFQQLSQMPKAHEDVLSTLAPEAAKAAPEYLQYAPQLALVGMVVVFGVSTWGAYRQVSKIVAALEARAKREEGVPKERPSNGAKPNIVLP